MTDAHLKRNILFTRIAALLFLLMLVRYRGIFVLLKDPSSNFYSIIVVGIFYLLNIMSMVGLFMLKRWGYISSYFSIPLSTFLFATSYFAFITDWIPVEVLRYLLPCLNAILLIWIVTLQVKRHRLQH